MVVHKVAYIVWMMIACQPRVYSETATDVKNLLNAIYVTDSYDPRVRPVTDQTKEINVTVDFTLTSIDFDAQNELLKTAGFLTCSWTDEFLVWSPGSYGGLETLYLPQNSIWRPDLSLRNSFERPRDHGLGSPFLNVRVDSMGEVTWDPLEIFESTCDVDITYYPFDVQECTLKFTAWSYAELEVNLKIGPSGIRISNYDSNSVWDLVKTDSETLQTDGTAVAFTFTLKRKASFYLITLIAPIILLTALNAAAFVLPIESGERGSYVITVFLAIVVFLSIYAEEIPENSDTVSLLAIYIVAMSSFSTLMVIVSVVQLRLAQRENAPSPVPVGRFYMGLVWLSEVARCRTCSKCRCCGKDRVKDISKEDLNETSDGKSDSVTWLNVVDAIDFLFFWISILFTIIVTFALAVIAYSYSSQFKALDIDDGDLL